MAITASTRSNFGARSVTLLVTSDGAGYPQQATNAQLQASATAAQQAALPIYSQFLNQTFADEAAMLTAAANLGINLSVYGGTTTSSDIDPNPSFSLDGGKPAVDFGSAVGVSVVHISLSHSLVG